MCGFSVFSLGKVSGNINYKVTVYLESTKENTTLIKDSQEIQQYSKTIFQQLDKFLPATRFKNVFAKDGMSLKYSIEVYDTSEAPKRSDDNSRANDDLAKTLECPICNEYMSGQIYNCSRGHSLCADCKKMLNKCPFCNANLTSSRNYVLEEIAEKTKLRCRNTSAGCTFVGEARIMKVHEENCHF